jgi:hypothetical protein
VTRVRLDAERLDLNGRRLYRIHADAFRQFLQAINWPHVPPQGVCGAGEPAGVAAGRRRRPA